MTINTIWKFTVPIEDETTVSMPDGALILHVGVQPGQDYASVCIRVLVNPDNQRVNRRFRVYGTGHPINPMDIGEHVGTFQTGRYVFHVFEAK